MEYALFRGFTRIGYFYFSIDEARAAIDGPGIWSICTVLPIDGKLKIVNRETVKIS